MHLPFDILKKERRGSFRRFEAVNDLGSAQQPIQQPEPIPQPAPEPAPEPNPEPAPEPAPPAPQSDSNAGDHRGPLLPESNSAARLWPTERRGASRRSESNGADQEYLGVGRRKNIFRKLRT